MHMALACNEPNLSGLTSAGGKAHLVSLTPWAGTQLLDELSLLSGQEPHLSLHTCACVPWLGAGEVVRRDMELPSSALHLLPDLGQPFAFLICTMQGMKAVCRAGALGSKHNLGRASNGEHE